MISRIICISLLLCIAGAVQAQDKKEAPPDPTKVTPGSGLEQRIIAIELQKEVERLNQIYATKLEDLRRENDKKIEDAVQKFREQLQREDQVRKDAIAAYVALQQREAEIRKEAIKEYAAQQERDNLLRKEAITTFLAGQKQEEELRELFRQRLEKRLREEIVRESQGGFVPQTGGLGAQPTAPVGAPTTFRVKGTIAKGAGLGGVILEVDGELRTLSVGDTFTVGGATYRVAGITPDGVSILAERNLVVH